MSTKVEVNRWIGRTILRPLRQNVTEKLTRYDHGPIMDSAFHQPGVRFDIRAERAEYQRLFKHQARVLQDRLARKGGSDRTREIPITEWERLYRKEADARRVLYQARALSWGKEKRFYYATRHRVGTDES